MTQLLVKARTAFGLGIRNLLRVGWFRLGVRCGWNPVRRLQVTLPKGPFFAGVVGNSKLVPSSQWCSEAMYFGRWSVPVTDSPPDWHVNPITGTRVLDSSRPWWKIPDFDTNVGDIKVIWEASRFDWVLAFAQRAAAGDSRSLERIESWLEDWCQRNPAFLGPNWKCGQEASFRVLHLALGGLILDSWRQSTESMNGLVKAHLARILPTLGYAIAQDNNHGTSEAAALFVGGSWLELSGDVSAIPIRDRGRALLEERVDRLIMDDGSFSQASVNYHRLVVDTLCVVEAWRRRLGMAEFSPELRRKAAAATRWLYLMVDPETGDAPNLGANDGSRLLPLSDAAYRDFRPTVQLASQLFLERRAYAASASLDLPAKWLGVAAAALPDINQKVSARMDDGGYGVAIRNRTLAMLRYPRKRFRPNQADGLHVDLWHHGRNLLRDGGSYGYNAQAEMRAYFRGTAGHNTIQFDGRDQMPSLGRFLFGDWLSAVNVVGPSEEGGGISFAAGYVDRQGVRHSRRMTLFEGKLVVQDEVSGFCNSAVLRWRLRPGLWAIGPHGASCDGHEIVVRADVPLDEILLDAGWESRHYLEKTELPVLRVTVSRPGTIISEYRWV